MPRRRVRGRAVLRAAESVDAHVLGDHHILDAERIGMDQRAGAVPVLRGICVCMTRGMAFGDSARSRFRMPSVRFVSGSVSSP